MVEIVKSYKYLGTYIDSKLDWHAHTAHVYSKVNKRMYFTRRLKYFGVNNTLINMFYKSTIESLICFCLIAWGGNTKQQDKTKIDRIIKKVNNITNVDNLYFNQLFRKLCKDKIEKIKEDQHHPLFHQIITSKRSKRLLSLKTKRKRYRLSFLPSAIRFYNE